jgi:hypothetical protein
MIEVRQTGHGEPLEFDVRVTAGGGESRHHVTMGTTTARQLGGDDHSPQQCVEAAFRFLLDREPKESIMGRFDVTVISQYFPEFEAELPAYLARR